MVFRDIAGGASFHQTVIVPDRNIARPLVVASLSPEFVGGPIERFSDFVSQLMIVDESRILSQEQIRNVTRQLVNSEVWHQIREPDFWLRYIRFFYPYDLDYLVDSLDTAASSWRLTFQQLSEQNLVGPDILGLTEDVVFRDVVSNVSYSNFPFMETRRRGRGTGGFSPGLRSAFIGQLWSVLLEDYSQLDIRREQLLQFAAFSNRLITIDPERSGRSYLEYLQYEVPISQSPEINGQTIGDLLAQARNVVYLPLAGFAIGAGQKAMEGDWLMAFTVAAAGGGSVVILAAAVSLAEWLMDFARRGRR